MTPYKVEDLRIHIQFVLQQLGMYSPSAEELLLGTAAHESHLGYWTKQKNGPACGIYQMEPFTVDSLWENYLAYRPELVDKVLRITGVTKDQASPEHLIYNTVYATVMARIYYWRFPATLPSQEDLLGQATYWKTHWNTERGRGTIKQYINDYEHLIIPYSGL